MKNFIAEMSLLNVYWISDHLNSHVNLLHEDKLFSLIIIIIFSIISIFLIISKLSIFSISSFFTFARSFA
jgi:hypothetical protein